MEKLSIPALSSAYDPEREKVTDLVDDLVSYTWELVIPSAANLVAFSGGVDSSLAALLVHKAFIGGGEESGGEATAVLGVSPAVSPDQIELARRVASFIGIPLVEAETSEGSDSSYVSNRGEACLVCKTHLYSALTAVARRAERYPAPLLFNGTNKDDLGDNSRVGLLAARRFRVRSPLHRTTKARVRAAARHLGLPNWDYAAAPCLRSRIAFGVQATKRHLETVRLAEDFVRRNLCLGPTHNLRVRMLAGNRARIELDPDIFQTCHQDLLLNIHLRDYIHSLGFTGGLSVAIFRSGSLLSNVHPNIIYDPSTSSFTQPIEPHSPLVP